MVSFHVHYFFQFIKYHAFEFSQLWPCLVNVKKKRTNTERVDNFQACMLSKCVHKRVHKREHISILLKEQELHYSLIFQHCCHCVKQKLYNARTELKQGVLPGEMLGSWLGPKGGVGIIPE